MIRRLLPLCAVLLLVACGRADVSPLVVSVIDEPAGLTDIESPRTSAGRHATRSSIAQGLVTYDAEGRVVPGLAERWIVTDDGLSYIFRLRKGDWNEGQEITAEEVARLLQRRLRAAREGRLAPELADIRDIRSMTGRVIEVRLAVAKPDILQVLAQPDMGVVRGSDGSGPMRADRLGPVMMLTMNPDLELEGADRRPQRRRPIVVRAESGSRAVARFATGHAELVLGGRVQDLPYVEAAGVSRSALRLDSVGGLFGLAVVEESGILADPVTREAIAMAIDRTAVFRLLNVDSWSTSDWIVPIDPATGEPRTDERWPDLDMTERRVVAATRINAAKTPDQPPLRIAMPEGPGSRLIFLQVRGDLRAVGLDAVLVSLTADADLRLVDEAAAYDSPAWYLGQLSCERQRLCSEEADFLLSDAESLTEPELIRGKWRDTEELMLAGNTFIPLGQPLRWSLARPTLGGFVPNPRARHPLWTLGVIPN